ncbi:bifunctional lysylphosphatidylglycerol flippase/synthetase MprF [Haladaptatus halobius]|uniref:bifunctional lysylphosphatidylglycerol flippase/synthetase MprF n=1 Tax=Haladaptatus halobius TaxID=2884875 RepID=UPI001D09F0FE|nr:bifunctional lysylphosphatidylglycerol flippase/synthetase MprF [Haladaptatus halobius]
MKRPTLKQLTPLFGSVVFALALFAIHRELHEFNIHEIIGELNTYSLWAIALAVGLTALGYVLMTGYDWLGFRYVNQSDPYRRTALPSFVGHAIGNNVGVSVLTGWSVRYRFYSGMGVTADDVTRIVGFCTLSIWLGLVIDSGLAFVAEPALLSLALGIPIVSVRIIGVILIVGVVAYVLWGVLRRNPIEIRGWSIDTPKLRLSFAQISLGIFDWAVAGMVLYVLLPTGNHIGYLGFLGVFFVAQLAGITSQVPGGLGVFEGVFLLLLSGMLPTTGIAAALIVYRIVYYLLPLFAAAIVLVVRTTLVHREEEGTAAQTIHRWAAPLVPTVLAVLTLLAGATLLITGAIPADSSRLVWLSRVLPLSVIELSHFLASLVGVGLLVLARGLQLRLDAAYLLTVAMLFLGIVLSILKGFDVEEALILTTVLAIVVPSRRFFYRRASLTREWFTTGWIVTILIVFGTSVWLGLFAFQHLEYSEQLWWQFSLGGNAPRFLRASVGTAVVLLAVALVRLLSPSMPDPLPPTETELERARSIAEKSDRVGAYLALLGDKSLLFNDDGTAFIMYAIEGRSWIALGPPVGPEEECLELAWRFHELASRNGGRSVFYQVGDDDLPVMVDLGLSFFRLGEEGRVPLPFSLEGKRRKEFRRTIRKVEGEDCTFEIIPRESVPNILPRLRTVSDEWLEIKGGREIGFSLGYFDDRYLKNFPIAVIRYNGDIVAFANVLEGGGKHELSVDLMRYSSDAPRRTMDYLFVQLMLWGSENGYDWFSLGMAPLSGFTNRQTTTAWDRIGAQVYQHGEHFYNYQGLRAYKAKFDPEWEPRYLACPGGLTFPLVLVHVITLISGGVRRIITR